MENRLRPVYRYLSQSNIVASVLPATLLQQMRTQIYRPVSALGFEWLEIKPPPRHPLVFVFVASGTGEFDLIFFLVRQTVTDDRNYSGCTLYTGVLRVDQFSPLITSPSACIAARCPHGPRFRSARLLNVVVKQLQGCQVSLYITLPGQHNLVRCLEAPGDAI